MTLKIITLLTLLGSLFGQQILKTQEESGQNIIFTYGSCFSQRSIQNLNKTSIFEKISEVKPDIFTWIGNFKAFLYFSITFNKQQGDAAYPKTFDLAIPSFNFTKNDLGYRILYNNNITSIVGVWDDHDYGKNDADKNEKNKHKMRQIYLDFLDEPKNSIRRTQPGGIYTSYYLGKTKHVKLVLLDVRFSRDAFGLKLKMFWVSKNTFQNKINYYPNTQVLNSGNGLKINLMIKIPTL